MLRIQILALVLAGANLAACSSEQGDVSSAHSDIAPPTANAVPSTVKVFVDPVTGEIREPTAAERASEAAKQKTIASVQAPQAAKAPREIKHADGTVEVIMDASSDQPLKACVQRDESVAVSHDDCGTQP